MHEMPMLNSPVELHSDAAEEFANSTIARLAASHDARKALKSILFEAVKPPVKTDVDRVEGDKRRVTALDDIFNRNTFGAAG